jgi:hypothetical protein
MYGKTEQRDPVFGDSGLWAYGKFRVVSAPDYSTLILVFRWSQCAALRPLWLCKICRRRPNTTSNYLQTTFKPLSNHFQTTFISRLIRTKCICNTTDHHLQRPYCRCRSACLKRDRILLIEQHIGKAHRCATLLPLPAYGIGRCACNR